MPKTDFGYFYALNITVPGLSVLYPNVYCVADHRICQVITGESEINAATTITALVLSGKFNLESTYFLISGIAGVNPKQSTLGGVALAKYAVQVALQYEFDSREIPGNYPNGYVPFGTTAPDQPPTIYYGTEVFELNEALRDCAFQFALNAYLSDNPEAAAYRAKYKTGSDVESAAVYPPSVVRCDTATSDVYYSGNLLSGAFENITTSWTNGSGVYCMTAQEDNATLEVLLRMAIAGLVDFGRVIVMRSGSDFDRPPPGITAYDHLFTVDQNGFSIALRNLFAVGIEIVNGIVGQWNGTFASGINATNYIGDVFGSLGGTPDFGPGDSMGTTTSARRALQKVNRFRKAL
ncbi:purine nucleoside permease [Lasiosphaeria miniovina]|uniref:Purine nucleoside permease n=1 Tax=Lasiosphaeria miniovina TaxID=1954250 RepID=A0AA39ZT40_9PEZI|nr:purine nucleoside permease [Lasiosphaeria miniovina]KAK0703154.1 purine nucleoside permease [Lasiosphaeria miniovina]